MTVKNLIAGALMDFAHYLSGSAESILVGSSAESTILYDRLRKWADERAIDLDDVHKRDWDAYMALRQGEAHPGFAVSSVVSCPTKPIARIVWGDGVETYVHQSESADLVHVMGRGSLIERRGAASAEEILGKAS